ncbi:ATP-binding protein [Kosmotoga pacifica]|uniref:(4Fe-4S)-binding protein n=1 Tax=Kosmotoga pacifica TaxID=1330330 RepID=A0A0G2ZDT7_9BACT|nr:ATP-binding protein [Kosmotoga pacifica]AKI97729.1 (4Fe-4S)-binding protein [Kosmotoga pacifica]
MKIAVVSGKGGTGKTTVATNLAWVLSQKGPVQLLDADVEEPNSHLFFHVKYTEEIDVEILLPRVDKEKCLLCGKCAKACQFGAISIFNTGVLIFDNLCHGCGTCSIACPTKAIYEISKQIGVVKIGQIDEKLTFGMGLLNIGEPSGVRVIRELKKFIDNSRTVIIDAPPGTSCPVVETLRGMDYAIMVTEATPFGLHDLKLAASVVKEMNIPMGIVINRASEDYKEIEEFAFSNDIPILEKIPFDRDIATSYSKGSLFVEEKKEWFERFERLYEKIAGVIV